MSETIRDLETLVELNEAIDQAREANEQDLFRDLGIFGCPVDFCTT